MLKSRVTEIILAAMYLRHGFSIEALTDQLKLMKIVAPYLSGGVFDSPYKFLKKYDAMKSGLRKLFLCHKCSVELECDEKTGNPVNDQPCGHVFKKNKACYSLFVPIGPQISYYIEHHLNDSTAQIGDRRRRPKPLPFSGTSMRHKLMRRVNLISHLVWELLTKHNTKCDGRTSFCLASIMVTGSLDLNNLSSHALKCLISLKTLE